MHFHDQSIRSGGNGDHRERRHQRGPSTGMTRIDDDRQVRLALEHRNRRHVHRVAGGGFVRADATFAQHHVAIALRHDVFGGHQQFGDGSRQPALEQHRTLHFADFGEQREVLHVARPDLQHVGVRRHEFHLPGVHHFRHDRHAGFGAHLGEDLQSGLAHALKRVRRRPRLECPATQQTGAGPLHVAGGFVHHLAAFHRTRTRHDDDVAAPDHRVRRITEADGGIPHRKFARRELVRLEDRQHPFDAVELGQSVFTQTTLVADAPDDGAMFAAGDVGAQTGRFDVFDDAVERVGGDVGRGDDDHAVLVEWEWWPRGTAFAEPGNNKGPCDARASRRWKRQRSAAHANSAGAHAGRHVIKSAGVAENGGVTRHTMEAIPTRR